MKRSLTSLALVPVAALALAACGGDDPIAIDGAWARTSPMATDRGAVYFEITADDGDTLLAASVDASVAGKAEIHEMVAAGDMGGMDDMGDDMSGDMGDMSEDMDDMADEMGSDDMSGDDMGDMDGEHGDDMAEMQMMMQEMSAGLPLPAGEAVMLEPGSYHVMLLVLVDPLETGETFEVTLDFADADDVTLEVEVMESAP